MTELDYEKWIGNTETRRDVITPWPVVGMSATLDRDDPEPRAGDPIPPGWHWFYFLEAKPAHELGPDGHPKRGGFLPPVALPRRMWAGGRIVFLHPLHVGDEIERRSRIMSVERKHGRSGELVFVTVEHTVSARGNVAVREEHDIVYREAATPGEAPPAGKPAPTSAPWHESLVADPVMLFRYSALTFNGHRIHYDLDYVKHEEHYPGLVVHGPLQITLLLELCRANERRSIRKLEYRAMHPVFHTERFTVNGAPVGDGATVHLWTANSAGHYAMSATARFD
jgi:3-methylfumaryl-CoA hydratase